MMLTVWFLKMPCLKAQWAIAIVQRLPNFN